MKKPRLKNYTRWVNWEYEKVSGKKAIQDTLNGVNNLHLAHVLNTYSTDYDYQDAKGHYAGWNYWRMKTPDALTEEDRTYLRWRLRGRVYDPVASDYKVLDNRKR